MSAHGSVSEYATGRLTAGATGAGHRVLGSSLLTVAVEGSLLATRALGFLGADAASFTATA